MEIPQFRKQTTEINFGIDRIADRMAKDEDDVVPYVPKHRKSNTKSGPPKFVPPKQPTPLEFLYRRAGEDPSDYQDYNNPSRRHGETQPVYPGFFKSSKFMESRRTGGLGEKKGCQSRKKKGSCSGVRRSSKSDIKDYEEIPIDKYFKRKKLTHSTKASLRQISSKFKNSFHSKVPVTPHTATEKLEEVLDDYYEDQKVEKPKVQPQKDSEEDNIIFSTKKKKLPKHEENNKSSEEFTPKSKLIKKQLQHLKNLQLKSEEKSSEEIISYKKVKKLPLEEQILNYFDNKQTKTKKSKKNSAIDFSESFGKKWTSSEEDGGVIYLDEDYIKKLALNTLNSHGNNFKKIIQKGEDCNDDKADKKRRKKIED